MPKCFHSILLWAIVIVASQLAAPSIAEDSDGDGQRDLIDAPGLRTNVTRNGRFVDRNFQDLDGANLLIGPRTLNLSINRITGIESGDFRGLTNLSGLVLERNQITDVESSDFNRLTNLHLLKLPPPLFPDLRRRSVSGL